MDAASPGPEPALPARLGRYRLVRPISVGGMARVYEARRESLAGVAPRVAIKVILPDRAGNERFRELFINEARVGAMVHHPNLVQIQDFEREGELYYLVMEFVEGLTLRHVITLCRRHGLPVPLSVVAEIGRQVCEGLHHAHALRDEVTGESLGLVHRDVKPSNVMLTPQGVVKVLDFGISATVARAASDGVKGTWGYLSPEQGRGGPVGPAADQYGLGLVLYELAALSQAYPEKEPQSIREAMGRDRAARLAAALAGPHAPIGPILVRALQRDPEARFPSCAVMARELGRLVGDPVRVREQLVSFYATLAGLDRLESVPGEVRVSPSTMGRPEPALPLRVGDAHGPALAEGPVAGPARSASRGPGRRWTPAAVALALLAVAVLAFTAHRAFTGRGSPPPTAEASAPVGSGRTGAHDAGTPPAGGGPLAPGAAAAPPVAGGPGPGPRAGPPATGGAVGSTPELPAAPAAPPAAPAPARAAVPAASPAGAAVAAPEASPGTGWLTVSSLPRALVRIDGQPVGVTPVFRQRLPAGAHEVVLETDDGRMRRFRVDVPADAEVRRLWHFDREQWVER